MIQSIEYDGRRIILEYKKEEEINKTNSPFKVTGLGKNKNYNFAEEEAISRLVNEAVLKKPRRTLKKIVGISGEDTIDKKRFTIHLNGRAIYESHCKEIV